jgi:hypothetical protein
MKLKKTLKVVILVMLSMITGIALTIICMEESGGLWNKKQILNPGTILFQSNSDEVRTLIFTTDKMTVVAQRSIPETNFAVQITYSDNYAPKHCSSYPNLGGVLLSLERIKVKKHLSAKELHNSYPIEVGFIEYRDAVMGETPEPWQIFTTNDRSKIAINRFTDAYEVDMPSSLIKKMEALCN